MNIPNYDLYDNSNSLASILSSIQNNTATNIGSFPVQANGSWATSTQPYPKQSKFDRPKFDMSFYQSENGGFIMELKDGVDANYLPKSKLFIIKEIENMGTEIQNILMKEILKG
jgi:hypothetical protein